MSAISFEEFPVCLTMNGFLVDVSGHAERRKRSRAKVNWPVRFLLPGGIDTLETVTQDLSSQGFYCLMKVPLAAGERVTCILALPGHFPAGPEWMLLECKAQIVRVETLDESEFYGVGCRIEDYRFLH